MFTRLEVIVLTNKQTWVKTSIALRYATTLGNERLPQPLTYIIITSSAALLR